MYYRIASPDRVRNTISTHRRGECGDWACLDCGSEVEQRVYDGKKRRPSIRCVPCGAERKLALHILSGQAMAVSAVNIAVKAGHLPRANTLQCVDCGRRGYGYDHRDYNHPLRVDPVCKSCNVMRGHAAPFNPYLVGLLLIEYVRQTAQGGLCDVNPRGESAVVVHAAQSLASH